MHFLRLPIVVVLSWALTHADAFQGGDLTTDRDLIVERDVLVTPERRHYKATRDLQRQIIDASYGFRFKRDVSHPAPAPAAPLAGGKRAPPPVPAKPASLKSSTSSTSLTTKQPTEAQPSGDSCELIRDPLKGKGFFSRCMMKIKDPQGYKIDKDTHKMVQRLNLQQKMQSPERMAIIKAQDKLDKQLDDARVDSIAATKDNQLLWDYDHRKTRDMKDKSEILRNVMGAIPMPKLGRREILKARLVELIEREADALGEEDYDDEY